MNRIEAIGFKKNCLSIGGIITVLLMTQWVLARRVESKTSSYEAQLRQLAQMKQDAGRILQLQDAPRLATEREKPNDALLSYVRDSMRAAGIPDDHWVGNDPLPAVRVPRTPYKRLAIRLRFERIDLKSLVSFALELTSLESALSISSLRLTAPRDEPKNRWNAVMKVSYLIYSPHLEQ